MNKLLFLVCISLFASCATVTSLPGGEKDTTPPLVLKSTPDSAQVGYYSKQIKISFDEYFTVQNLPKELIVSPPFEKSIAHKIKGKTLFLELPEYPTTNSTYQLHFGDAIRDVNEGNILKNFSLVFSTGSFIDSGTLSGSILDSRTLSPQSQIKIFLYRAFSDSNVLKSPPYYLSITDSSGNYKFNHLAEASYQIAAVKDENNNNRLDFGEAIAFIDSLIPLSEQPVLLKLFIHRDNRPLRVMQSKEISAGVFSISLNRQFDTSNLKIKGRPLTKAYTKEGHLPFHLSDKKEEIHIYLSETDASTNDSIHFTIIVEADTLKHTVSRAGNPSSFTNKMQLVNPSQHHYLPIRIASKSPILKTNSLKMFLFNQTDSTVTDINNVNLSSIYNLEVSADLKPGKSYRLIFDSTATTFYNSNKNIKGDTFFLTSFKPNELGEVELNVSIDSGVLAFKSPLLIELYQKGTVENELENIYRGELKNDTTFIFKDLIPGEYFTRAFSDIDGNQKWTEGNFSKKRQSEPIFIKSESIMVRANWETKNIFFLIK
jgi:uncharacterized protein (DUF2141 family)